jgi:carboxyl-terminal processing protease
LRDITRWAADKYREQRNAAFMPQPKSDMNVAFQDWRTQNAWSYQNGKALTGSDVAVQVSAQPYRISRPDAPVAVLLGKETASSGEIIALALTGRPNTRSFGSPTRGLTTANMSLPMSDGALIFLTIAVVADRSGKAYGGEITPDVETSGDGFPKEALQWLDDQPACKRRGGRL